MPITTNRNIKRLVTVLPIRIVNSNVSTVDPSSERNRKLKKPSEFI